MKGGLPDLDLSLFSNRLEPWLATGSAPGVVEKLLIHYRELRLWSSRISLVGPGTAGSVVERHYGESLLATPLVSAQGARLVDLGSGAGFPGFVLAAANPGLEVTLVEAQERKWAFLRAVCRKASLPCNCLNARVGAALPDGFPDSVDFITIRALKVSASLMDSLSERLSPGGCFLFWCGQEDPAAGKRLSRGREIEVPGSASRRILELRHG